jgi:hypothetical protein
MFHSLVGCVNMMPGVLVPPMFNKLSSFVQASRVSLDETQNLGSQNSAPPYPSLLLREGEQELSRSGHKVMLGIDYFLFPFHCVSLEPLPKEDR